MKIKLFFLAILLIIPTLGYTQEFKGLNIIQSEAYNKIEIENKIEDFISNNHNTYKNIRLRERKDILKTPLHENCYKIYFGIDLFKENKSEALYCLETILRQGDYNGAKEIVNIKIKEKDWLNAAIYYGIMRGFTNEDYNSKNTIINEIGEEKFFQLFDVGLYKSKDLQLFIRQIQKNDFNDVLIFDKSYINQIENLPPHKNKMIKFLNNKDFNEFINLSKNYESDGTMILLLAQANLNNFKRLSEYCFKLNDNVISRSCLQNIFIHTNYKAALNRFTYYIVSGLRENIKTKDIVMLLGFNFNDFVSQRLFDNILVENKSNLNTIADFIYYYNMGRVKRINYEKNKAQNEK